MRLAIREAQAALDEDEVPIGAVIVRDDNVIAAAHNMRESASRPDGPRRDARHHPGGGRHRRLAPGALHALRHARALPDVRRRDGARPHPARRLRRYRPQSRRRSNALPPARRPSPQPPRRSHLRHPRRRMRRTPIAILRTEAAGQEKSSRSRVPALVSRLLSRKKSDICAAYSYNPISLINSTIGMLGCGNGCQNAMGHMSSERGSMANRFSISGTRD